MKNEWFTRIKGLGLEEVSNENLTIYFISEDEIDEAMKDIGRKTPWNKDWIIIGFDDETDDVIFLNEQTGQICTAYEFEKKWEVVVLFPSVNEFLKEYGY